MRTYLLVATAAALAMTLATLASSKDLVSKRILGLALLGQLLAIYGSVFKQDLLVEVSHRIFSTTLLLGALFGNTEVLKLVILLLLVTIFTGWFADKCMFMAVYLQNQGSSNVRQTELATVFYMALLPLCIFRLNQQR